MRSREEPPRRREGAPTRLIATVHGAHNKAREHWGLPIKFSRLAPRAQRMKAFRCHPVVVVAAFVFVACAIAVGGSLSALQAEWAGDED
jgi:hypothetical protein